MLEESVAIINYAEPLCMSTVTCTHQWGSDTFVADKIVKA